MKRLRRRLRMAGRLAYAALRGRLIHIEAGTPDGGYHFVGIPRR